jgi:hypothetical protein
MSETKPRGYSCLDMVRDGSKHSHLCCVKYCRTRKANGRRVCHKHHMMAWRLNNPLKAAYATLRDHAKRRKLKFTLTLKQFESIVIPSGYLDHKGNTRYDLHIDRIDPLRGYEYDNIQVLTCSENSAKGATKDKSKYVAERLARIAAMKLPPADDPGMGYSTQDEYDETCPF